MNRFFTNISMFFKKREEKKNPSKKESYACQKEKHVWNYYTWGNAFVDNLDGTFSPYDIGKRSCKKCKTSELHLKNGWEKDKDNLNIYDLFEKEKETV